jgi:hypothetical protein
VTHDARFENRTRRLAKSRRRPWQYSLAALLAATTLCAVLLKVGKAFPLETLIVGGIVAGAVAAVGLYVGELVVIGWILDLPVWLAERAMPTAHVPLEFEHVGAITIVTLSDNIASTRECRSVRDQFDRLIADQHCDLILDFGGIKKLASGFRAVLLHVTRAARAEAYRQGQVASIADVPPGETFRVFDERQSALEEMARHAGHGWVVLCSVPTGTRAVYGTE